MNGPIHAAPMTHQEIIEANFADAQKSPRMGLVLTTSSHAGEIWTIAMKTIESMAECDEPDELRRRSMALALTLADDFAADAPTDEGRIHWADVARHLRKVQLEHVRARNENNVALAKRDHAARTRKRA